MKLIPRLVSKVILLLFLWYNFGFAQTQPHSSSITLGESHMFYSDILDEERMIYIHLPSEYQNHPRSYPILYLLDAEKHFYHVSSTYRFLAENNKIPPMIIVGIVNTDRTRDFTPYTTYNPQFPSAGKAENFQRFLKKELFPWVKKSYRVNDYKLVLGHSFGGLFSLYTLSRQPKMFQAYLAISPSLWWNQELHVDELISNLNKDPMEGKRIYMAWGAEGPSMISPARKLAQALENHNATNYQSSYSYMPEENHSSIVNRAVYTGLEHLFEGWELEQLTELDSFKKHYQLLSDKYEFPAFPSQLQVDDFAYKWIAKQNADMGLSFLIYNTELYPQSAFTYYRLGEAYELVGKDKKAIELFKTAYRLAQEQRDKDLDRYKLKVE